VQDITLKLNVQTMPPIFLRKRHALILVRDQNGKFVLGSKNIYPQGIDRLVGGGIEPDEDPQEGAARELAEELGLELRPDELVPLAKVTAEIKAEIKHEARDITFVTYIYFFQVADQVLEPDDDLDGLAYLTEAELLSLIKAYQKLPKTIDSKEGFAWFDYGQLYSQIHQIALDEYLKLAQS